MADKLDPKIDTVKLRSDLVKLIKGAVEAYEGTVKEIKSRELKKAELCLLCGNEDKPGKCICLKKNDVMGYGDANMPQGGSPMIASEHPDVQGAMAVKDKPEPGAKMPGGEIKDDQPDEGSGGLTKDEALAGLHNRKASSRTVAALRQRSMHPDTKASLAAVGVKGMAPPPGAPKPMGKGEKMDPQTGARIKAIADDRTKDIINKPKVNAARTKLPMGKKEDSYSQHKVEVNMKEYKKNPSKFPGGKKQAIAIGLSEGREHAKKAEMSPKYGEKVGVTTNKDTLSSKSLTKLNAGRGGPVPAVRKDEMEKTSVEQANKELGSAKSIAGKPIPGMGTKIANPQAMSPGKGMPKPVSGTINKTEKKSNKSRLKEVLGKCAMCKAEEHTGMCKDESLTGPAPTEGFLSQNHNRTMLKIKR